MCPASSPLPALLWAAGPLASGRSARESGWAGPEVGQRWLPSPRAGTTRAALPVAHEAFCLHVAIA